MTLTPHLTLTCRVGIPTVISFQRLSKLCNLYQGADSPCLCASVFQRDTPIFSFGILRKTCECSRLQTRAKEMRSRKRWDEDLDEGGIYTYIYSPIMEKNLERKYEVKKTGKAGLLATCQTLKATPLFCQNNTLANLK